MSIAGGGDTCQLRATNRESRLGGVLGGRAGGGCDEESRERYASHCVRRTETGTGTRRRILGCGVDKRVTGSRDGEDDEDEHEED